MKPSSLRSLILLMVVFSAATAGASTYSARFTTGAYASKETFSEASDGQTSNDFSTISSRIFFHASDVGRSGIELVSDLRDKHDFFDKLDRERLELNERNTFQLRQLAAKYKKKEQPLYASVGRFPVPEAGSVDTDGAEMGFRWTPSLRTSLFGGFNPKQIDQHYVTFNPNAKIFGTYTLLQPENTPWGKYFYLSNAAVTEMVSGHTDRIFWFNNFVYRWAASGQLTGLLYLDFVPRVYVQTGYLSWLQEISTRFTTTTGFSAIDVIQYTHRRGVLETLQPSPYREATLNLQQRINPDSSTKFFINYNAIYGVRIFDGRQLNEVSLGPSFPQFIREHFSAGALVGYRKNFVSKDTFLRLNTGYYSNRWEVTLDSELGIRRESDQKDYHPTLFELGIANYLSKSLYATVSLQRAATERVTILSGFLKIGYRFGSAATSPLRDGAPPRGKL